MNRYQLDIPQDRIAEFCGRHHIRRLALFGSVLREDFRADSDVDVLVEFAMQDELSALLLRKVDLNTAGFLSDYFRDEVLAEAEDLYVAA